jgi:hypothetical protein
MLNLPYMQAVYLLHREPWIFGLYIKTKTESVEVTSHI